MYDDQPLDYSLDEDLRPAFHKSIHRYLADLLLRKDEADES
jgi:hypothetical protein